MSTPSGETIEGFIERPDPAAEEFRRMDIAIAVELFVEILALNALHGRIGRDVNQLLNDIKARELSLRP